MTTAPESPDREINERILPVDLLARRSPWSPIFRLPPEVLQIIFLQCARDYYFEEEFPYRIKTVPTWVNISYVCRRWRDVALHCPTLWTYHFVLSLRWTEVLLARSKQASLKIRTKVGSCRRDESWWTTLLELLMKHAERIQELHLSFCCDFIQEKLSKLSICSRHLQSLKILLPPEELGSEPLDSPTVPIEGDTPALQKLKLCRCSVPWYSLSLNTLTTLDLFHIPIEFQKDAAEFLVILGSMRDLVRLYLDRAISGTSFPTEIFGSSPPRISLPRLTRLSAAASFPTIITLLSCLMIPLDAEIRLNCLHHTQDDVLEDYGSLSSLLAHRFKASDGQTSPLPTIRSVVLQPGYGYLDYDPYELAIIFSSSERDCNSDRLSGMSPGYDHEWDCKIPLKIFVDISTEWRESSQARIVSSICRPLPLENVQSIYAIRFLISLDLWRDTLGRFPKLQHIKLSHGGWSEIGSALAIPPQGHTENQGGDAGQRSDQSRIYGETLEELELDDVDCWDGPSERDQDWLAHTDLQPLWDALATRRTRFKITMTQCRVYGDAETTLADFTEWWEGGECLTE